MAARVLALSLQDILGEAALEGDRAGSRHTRIAARCGVAPRGASRQFRPRSDRTSQTPSREDRVPDCVVGGSTIHYESAGTGHPLVLLHGIGSNSRSWHRQLEILSRDFQVIAWDAPGYGRSSDPEGRPSIAYYTRQLAGLVDDLRLDRIHLLGHSFGGVVAQEFYRVYPDRLNRLILADTTFRGSRGKLEERLTMIRTMTP